MKLSLYKITKDKRLLSVDTLLPLTSPNSVVKYIKRYGYKSKHRLYQFTEKDIKKINDRTFKEFSAHVDTLVERKNKYLTGEL